MLISEAYREQNRRLHETNEHYGTTGHRFANPVQSLMAQLGTDDVLDYGCGKETLKGAIGPQIKGYDPCISALSAPPEAADIVVCTDVLEHIEPDCLDEVLDDLRRLTKQAILLDVSTVPAKKKLPDGRNAHLIIADFRFWLPKLWERWDIQQYQNLGPSFWTIGRPC